MTVETDDHGVAIVRMTATSGTIHTVNIMVASPVTSGQVKFVVDVLPSNKKPV